MKMSKKPSKDRKSFSYRLGEVFGVVAGTVAGTFATAPSPVDARNHLDKKGKEKLKNIRKQTPRDSLSKKRR